MKIHSKQNFVILMDYTSVSEFLNKQFHGASGNLENIMELPCKQQCHRYHLWVESKIREIYEAVAYVLQQKKKEVINKSHSDREIKIPRRSNGWSEC